MNVSCSDGSSGSESGFSENAYVSQDVNRISIDGDEGINTGLVIISETPDSGTVQKSGSFSTSSSAILNDILLGDVRGTTNTSGVFTQNGWSADISANLQLLDFGETCTVTSTYSGAKISDVRIRPSNINNTSEKSNKINSPGFAEYLINSQK